MYPQRSVMTCGLATALEPPHFNHAPVRGATPAPDLRIRGRVVSIHAPAWGATWWTGPSTAKTPGFQSTHPRGVRQTYRMFLVDTIGFQSTHPRGVRRVQFLDLATKRRVSIHAPAWGATRQMRRSSRMSSAFQSTHPRGVRRGTYAAITSPWWKFQSTHPRGVRLSRITETGEQPASFNPRTRVGCDDRAVVEAGHGQVVSIHAPAWGATRGKDARSRHGIDVSIHAPAWGATLSLIRTRFLGTSFNPRTRVGCDFSSSTSRLQGKEFQSTHPRGVRPEARDYLIEMQMFQSTHPRGVRPLPHRAVHPRRVVSIHAPAWGATDGGRRNPGNRCVSIHAPAWGATNHLRRMPQDGLVSIHAPAWGATHDPGSGPARWNGFQSTHPRGVRPAVRGGAGNRAAGFNPRTRVGCDWTGGPRPKSCGRFQSTHPRGVRLLTFTGRITGEETVSIHAPAWGATRWRAGADRPPRGFNPRTRVGCDAGLSGLGLVFLLVSIHAPAWGAT